MAVRRVADNAPAPIAASAIVATAVVAVGRTTIVATIVVGARRESAECQATGKCTRAPTPTTMPPGFGRGGRSRGKRRGGDAGNSNLPEHAHSTTPCLVPQYPCQKNSGNTRYVPMFALNID